MNATSIKIHVLLLILVNGEHLPEDCGTTRFDMGNQRIVGGDFAELGQFPWIARIGVINKRSSTIRFFCAGSLISRYFVVTAAHCRSYYFNIVRLGENYVDKEIDCDELGVCAPLPQDMTVKTVCHAGYCTTDYKNDFALIELEKPVEINEFVRPVCLPKEPKPKANYLGQGHLIIAGWGLLKSFPRQLADRLMYISAPIVDDDQCNSIYSTDLSDSQLCIGYEKEKDSCNGDSGGPVIKTIEENGQRRSYLIGIVSFGMPICGRGPAVYTDVSSFLNWTLDMIDQI